jgi:hypothetical protein
MANSPLQPVASGRVGPKRIIALDKPTAGLAYARCPALAHGWQLWSIELNREVCISARLELIVRLRIPIFNPDVAVLNGREPLTTSILQTEVQLLRGFFLRPRSGPS